jgi:large subunit ribosomal protein L23
MLNPYSVIETILVSEKSMDLKDANKYVFKVNKSASKIDIAHAVEKIYDVKVKDVNVMIRKGKPKRMGRRSVKQGYTASAKRAIVTLSDGSIDVI